MSSSPESDSIVLLKEVYVCPWCQGAGTTTRNDKSSVTSACKIRRRMIDPFQNGEAPHQKKRKLLFCSSLGPTRLSPKQSGFVMVFRVSQIAVHCARKERRETNKRVGVQGRRFEFLNEQHVLSVFCFVRQEIGTLSSGLLGGERCVRCCCQAM